MRRTTRGTEPRGPATAAARAGTLIAALVLATSGLAGAVEPAASLTADPASGNVAAGASRSITFTATLEDGSSYLGCLRVQLPDGWVITDVTGVSPASAWTAGYVGTTATWAANNNGARVRTAGGTAAVTVTATAPATPGETSWSAEVMAAGACTGDPLATTIAAITVTGGMGGGGGGGGGGHDDGDDDHEHEGPPAGHPGFAFEGGNGDAEGRHGVVIDVTHTADDNRGEWRIKCIIVTLPEGYTDVEVTGILPESGWMGSVDMLVVRYGAGEGGQPLRLPSPGQDFPMMASFLVTATPPEGDGPFEWSVAAYSPEACEDVDMATPLRTTSYVYDEGDPGDTGGGGGGGTVDTGGGTTTTATDTTPAIIAADPPIPALIPAGEGPAPIGARTTAVSLAVMATALGLLAAALRRRGGPEVVVGTGQEVTLR